MSLSANEWQNILEFYDFQCVMCGDDRTFKPFDLKCTNRDNTSYVPLCPTCKELFLAHRVTNDDLANLGITSLQYKRYFENKVPQAKSRKSSENSSRSGSKSSSGSHSLSPAEQYYDQQNKETKEWMDRILKNCDDLYCGPFRKK